MFSEADYEIAFADEHVLVVIRYFVQDGQGKYGEPADQRGKEGREIYPLRLYEVTSEQHERAITKTYHEFAESPISPSYRGANVEVRAQKSHKGKNQNGPARFVSKIKGHDKTQWPEYPGEKSSPGYPAAGEKRFCPHLLSRQNTR